MIGCSTPVNDAPVIPCRNLPRLEKAVRIESVEDYPNGITGLRNNIINLRGIFQTNTWPTIKWRLALYRKHLKNKYGKV